MGARGPRVPVRRALDEQIHYVMRRTPTGVQRSARISQTSGSMFCGICLRGQVKAHVGAECISCGSRVIAQMKALSGGSGRPEYATVQAEKWKRATARAASAARTGNLFTMPDVQTG